MLSVLEKNGNHTPISAVTAQSPHSLRPIPPEPSPQHPALSSLRPSAWCLDLALPQGSAVGKHSWCSERPRALQLHPQERTQTRERPAAGLAVTVETAEEKGTQTSEFPLLGGDGGSDWFNLEQVSRRHRCAKCDKSVLAMTLQT